MCFRGKRSEQLRENTNVLTDDSCRAVAGSCEQEAQKSPRFQSEAITAAGYTAASEFQFFAVSIYEVRFAPSTITDRPL